MEVAEFRVPLLPELSGTKLISAGGAYVPLLPQAIFGFPMWRCRTCFLCLLFFRDSWVLVKEGFVIKRPLTVCKCIIFP